MSFRDDWKARLRGIEERAWLRRQRIAHQQRVQECFDGWNRPTPPARPEPESLPLPDARP